MGCLWMKMVGEHEHARGDASENGGKWEVEVKKGSLEGEQVIVGGG